MKKSIFTLFLLIAGLAAFTAEAETRVLNIKQSFSALDASAGVKIIYQPTSGGQRTVKITGDTKRINEVDVRISGKTLKISPKANKMGSRSGNRIKGVVVTVIAPMVDDIEASSGASIRCNTAMNTGSKKMEIDVSSGAVVNFSAISCRKIEVDASSGSVVNIKSLNADKAELDVSSGAAISLSTATTKDIDCEASSGATIKLGGGTSVKGSFSASSGGSIKGSTFTVRDSRIDKSVGGSIRLNTRN